MIPGWAKTLAASVLLAQAILQPSASAAQDPKPVLQALLRFLDALEAADAPTLRQLISVQPRPDVIGPMRDPMARPMSPEMLDLAQQGRNALVDLIVAQKKLERAAESRFPAQAKRFRTGLDLIASPADRKAIADASVTTDDDGPATVALPGQASPVTMTLSSDGQWQVALDIAEPELDGQVRAVQMEPPGFMQLRIERLRAFAQAFDSTATAAATFTDAAAAETSLLDRLTAARADYLRKLEQLRARPPTRRSSRDYMPD